MKHDKFIWKLKIYICGNESVKLAQSKRALRSALSFQSDESNHNLIYRVALEANA